MTFPSSQDSAPLTLTTLFHLPELAELILLELSIHDLLIIAQRINKQWHNIINTSPRLQQALFFQPVPSPALELYTESLPPVPHRPRGAQKLNAYFVESVSRKRVEVIGNPFIDHINAISSYWEDDLIVRPEASWRRMLLCQPPLSTISFVHIKSGSWNDRSNAEPDLQVTREGGILLRQALFESDHIKQGYTGVPSELRFLGKATMAWEVERIVEAERGR